MNYEIANDDGMDEALTALLRAVERLGLERAGDAVMAYQDTPDEDAADWSFGLLNAIRTALQLAENAERMGVDARDVAFLHIHYGGGEEAVHIWSAGRASTALGAALRAAIDRIMPAT